MKKRTENTENTDIPTEKQKRRKTNPATQITPPRQDHMLLRSSNASGMVGDHIRQLSSMFQERHAVGVYRPINISSAPRLKEGCKPKTMITKGKTSEFPLIAGLVPSEPLLSKLLTELQTTTDSNKTQVGERINKLREWNEVVINSSEDQLKAIKEKDGIAKKIIKTLDDTVLHSKIHFKDSQKRETYYLLKRGESEELNEVYLNDNGEPRFIIKSEDNKFTDYNPTPKENINVDELTRSGYELQPVEVMCYRQFKLLDDEVVEVESVPITADYDELTSTEIFTFPLEQKRLDNQGISEELTFVIDNQILNKTEFGNQNVSFGGEGKSVIRIERLEQTLSRLNAELNQLSSLDITDSAQDLQRANLQARIGSVKERIGKDDVSKIFGENLYLSINNTATTISGSDLEKIFLSDKIQQEMNIVNAVSTDPLMGKATELHAATKAVERVDVSGGATNHASEITNENPEKLGNGNYPAFYPDGRVSILRNGKEICDFVNQHRNLGYPVPVNPRWFWFRDKDDQLFIPDDNVYRNVEINWQKFASIKNTEMASLQGNEVQCNVVENIYSKFLEYLHFDSSPDCIYAVRSDSADTYNLVKENLKNNYRAFRQKKLTSLHQDIKALASDYKGAELERDSNVANFILDIFIPWREKQIGCLGTDRRRSFSSPGTTPEIPGFDNLQSSSSVLTK